VAPLVAARRCETNKTEIGAPKIRTKKKEMNAYTDNQSVNELSMTHFSLSGDIGDFKPLRNIVSFDMMTDDDYAQSVNTLGQAHFMIDGEFVSLAGNTASEPNLDDWIFM
jgi:hypothetical protein